MKRGSRITTGASSIALAAAVAGCTGTIVGGEEMFAAGESSSAADTYAVTSANRLVAFERSTGAVESVVDIMGLHDDDAVIGMDYRPYDGELYVVTRQGRLYVLDPGKGTLLMRATLSADAADTTSPFEGLQGEAFGVNFNPVADRLRVVSDAGQNLRVNPETGATVTDGAPNPGTRSISAAAYSNSFSTSCRTQLFVIDASTGELFLQDPPNDGALAPLGQLRAPRAERGNIGFEIVMTSEGRGSALAFWPTVEGADIYDLDLRGAALSNRRALALPAGELLVGVSAPPPAEPPRQLRGELLGATASGRLVSFNRGAPGQLCTDEAITGLGEGESVLGMDVRPATGDLYVLGSEGTLYVVDVSTGEATPSASLRAAPGDTTQPFTSLPADVAYGVGFNPVPDRLRVVSRGGLNLRIDVDTGATITDGPLSPASMAVPAIAYTNTFDGASSTTLYALDAAGGALTRIGGDPATAGACPEDRANPNCGAVVEVGALGLDDMTDVGGFDIGGAPESPLGLVALTLGGAQSSSLYVVDLATGALAPPPGVGDPTIGGREPVQALTFATDPDAP